MKGPEIVRTDGDTLVLSLAKGLYPLDVVYGAAYVFIDRAYVFLGKDGDATVVELRAKSEGGLDGEALAGEFANELLNQALRKRLTRDNQNVLEAIVTQALAGATGSLVPSAFEDDDDDDDLDFLDDPLGIAVPWEERFKKRGSAPAQKGPDTEKEAGPGDSGGYKPAGDA